MSQTKQQTSRFLLVGLTAVAVDWLVYSLLIHQLSYPVAKSLSFIAGSFVSYFANKFWTFEQKERNHREVGQFVSLYIFTLAMNTIVNSVVLNFFPSLVFFAYLCATATSTILNFVGQKYWVFEKEKTLTHLIVAIESFVDSRIVQLKTYAPKLSGINWYWIISFIIAAILLIVRFPSINHHPEMWLENASNFFRVAWNFSFIDGLFTPDAGYLPLLPRLISLVTVKIGIIKYYPHVVQWAAVLFLSFFYSFFNWRNFKALIPADGVRFFISLLLGIFLFQDGEYVLFLNFAYSGFIFILLLLFVNTEKLSYSQYSALIILAALLILSKAYFISFIPLSFLAGAYFLQKKRWKDFIVSIILFFAAVLQAYATTVLKESAVQIDPIKKITLHDVLFTLIPDNVFYFIQLYTHVGVVDYQGFGWYSNVIGLILFVLLFGFSVFSFFYFKKQRSAPVFFWATNILAFVYLSMTVYVNHSDFLFSDNYQLAQWSVFFEFSHIRHFYIPYVLVLLASVVLVTRPIKYRLLQILVIVGVMCSLYFYGSYDVVDRYTEDKNSLSQWEYYYPLLQNDAYCIPVNHEAWSHLHSLFHNCRILNPISFIPQAVQGKVGVYKLSEARPFYTNDWKVNALLLKQSSVQKPRDIRVVVRGSNGKKIATLKSLTPKEYTFQYYLLDNPAVIDSIEFVSAKGTPVKVDAHMTFYGTSDQPAQMLRSVSFGIDALNGQMTQRLSSSTILEQIVAPQENNFSGISMIAATYNEKLQCTLRMELLNEETGEMVDSHTQSCAELKNDKSFTYYFNPVIDSAGKKYRLRVTTSDSSNGPSLYLTSRQNFADNQLFFNSEKQLSVGLAHSLVYSEFLQ